MSEPNPGALAAGQIFHGRYEIVRCLKAGGMGAVYECVHLKTRKRRALKVMLPQVVASPGMRERFELEARVTAEIESEHIVETFDAGVDDVTGAPFLVMELLRGEELSAILQRRGPLPAGETVLLLSQAALALDRTHVAGIVHRDLKPENLYVTTRDDGSPRLKILDFGIAKVVADGSHTVQQTAMIGTPLYMSQEQILGEGSIGPRSDVYALAHIAFALLTGRAYWSDEQKATPAIYTFLGKVMAGVQEAATSRAAGRGVTLPAGFDAWFARGTAKVAGERFEKASVLVQELAVVLGVGVARGAGQAGAEGGLVDERVPAPRGPEASAPQISGGTTPLVPSSPGSGPGGEPAPTVGDATTVVASSTSKSLGAAPRRSRVPVAMVGLVAMGTAGIGVVVLRGLQGGASSTAVADSAATVAMAAEMPVAATATAEAVPALPPSVVPAKTGSAPIPSASAAPIQPVAKQAPISTARPAAAGKPAAPGAGCDPPYVTDGAGHRRMKPQCL